MSDAEHDNTTDRFGFGHVDASLFKCTVANADRLNDP